MGQTETENVFIGLCKREEVIQIEGTYFYIGNKQLVEKSMDIPVAESGL